jgi:hypothetical protein
MRDILIKSLHTFLSDNYPELLVPLQADCAVTQYLNECVDGLGDLPAVLMKDGQPPEIVREICLDTIVKRFGPSKFNYVCSILQEDYEKEYYEWLDFGILKYEVFNILQECAPVFEHLGFKDDSDEEKVIRYAVAGTIQQYLNISAEF